MEIYLVGGAVRDRYLGLPVDERDFLVVGATAQQMSELGYLKVGKDFPVFLHPETREEYALARAARGIRKPEENSGVASVTLEEDLSRRDLTINAMAESADGRLLDPFGGMQDLRNRLLRHVSAAFSEDPIRILRVARFMARYHDLHFQVATETMELMRRMVDQGEMEQLVPERVWQEIARVLALPNPQPFFKTLRECGALAIVIPELDRLWGIPQPERWHPEIDCGVHSMMALQASCDLTDSLEVRFAALTHDLGKGLSPKELLPSHPGHEERGAHLVFALCKRLRVPNRMRQLAEMSARYHTHCHRLFELKPRTILKVMEATDAFRLPDRFKDFLKVCEADFLGRKGFEQREYPQKRCFLRLFKMANEVDRSGLRQMPQGRSVGLALHDLRLRAIKSGLAS